MTADLKADLKTNFDAYLRSDSSVDFDADLRSDLEVDVIANFAADAMQISEQIWHQRKKVRSKRFPIAPAKKLPPTTQAFFTKKGTFR